MKLTRKQLSQLITEEHQAQRFITLVNEDAGKAIGDALGQLMKDEKFRALIIQLLSQAATDWIPAWLKNRKEQKELETQGTQAPAADAPVDEDGDGIPDEDEYDAMEDEITQVIDRRTSSVAEMILRENKMKVTHKQLRRLIRGELNSTLTEGMIPGWLKVLSDMVGFEPIPKLAKALSNAKGIDSVDKVAQVSDETIRAEMTKMDEFDYPETIATVIKHKSSIPDMWVDAGGALNPWY